MQKTVKTDMQKQDTVKKDIIKKFQLRPNRVCPDKYINTWPKEPSFKSGKFGLADQTLSKTNTTAASARQICPFGSVPPWQLSSHKCFQIYFVFSLPLKMCLCYSRKCWFPPQLQKRKCLLFEYLVQEEGWILNITTVWFVTTSLCSVTQYIFFSTVSEIMDKIQQGELQTLSTSVLFRSPQEMTVNLKAIWHTCILQPYSQGVSSWSYRIWPGLL